LSALANVAIRVRGLGKEYAIAALKHAAPVERTVSGAGGAVSGTARHPTVWALRDVSFELPHGQVMGVIGRNGSGKSTLMKILSRITFPTEGMAETWGRVGALLEVGTGFHPELSGRDNIALSGAILGMSKREIAALEEQIIEFSGIGPFVDTAVKHYSSGMFLRLGFSVSAHLRSEIMLVDEVLSVGDAAFQLKSIERMRTVVQEGRSVLFISHNMESVRQLCDTSIVLDAGKLVYAGPTEGAVKVYNRETAESLAVGAQGARPG
jgi:lipopolysaccharide transport system ATP-binding protein